MKSVQVIDDNMTILMFDHDATAGKAGHFLTFYLCCDEMTFSHTTKVIITNTEKDKHHDNDGFLFCRPDRGQFCIR